MRADAAAISPGGSAMIRKVLMPAVAMALLGGCVTPYPYQYTGGSGDYYYGQPYVEYRDYGGYYGGLGYGYPYGWYGSVGFGGYYGYPFYGPYRYWGGGYPYWGGYGGYGYPYTWRYYPDHRPGGGHHHDDDHSDGGGHPDRPQPPWRNLDDLRPRHGGNLPPQTSSTTLRPVMATPSQPAMVTPSRPVMQPSREPAPRPMPTPRATRAAERDASRGSEP